MAANEPILILVVEDEVLIRMDIADELEGRGFLVLEASNADEAIALLSERSDIAVVFTDVDMPGTMDGIKLADAVRRRWPPVKIVVTSGHRQVDAAMLPSGSVFVPKPYLADQIAAKFDELTGQSSARELNS